jgi:hypothetical protein
LVKTAQRKSQDYASSTQGQLIVGDYKVFAEKGVIGLINGLINGKEQINIYLGYRQLLVYLEQQLLEEMFIALLCDNENPKAYKESFSQIKDKYGDKAEQLLKRLTRSY